MSVRDCSGYRPWLAVRAAAAGVPAGAADGADAGALEVPPDVAADLDRHLAACRACRTEVEELALLSFAIRRAWSETRDLEPPADAWLRLRDRVTRPSPSRRLAWAASSIAGAAMGTALAIGLIAPLGAVDMWGDGARVIIDEQGSRASPKAPPRSSEDLLELDWLRAREATTVVGIGRSRLGAVPGTGPRAVFATVRRDQSRYAEDRWDERPPAASQVPPAIVL